jgi:hypothetical protein
VQPRPRAAGPLDQACIGCHRVAGRQQHDVARHQCARLQHLLAASTQHPHAHRSQPPQRRHRALGPPFLKTADQRVDQHHGQDDHGIAVMAQRHCQPRGHEENEDQRALELLREGAPQGLDRHFGQRVRPVLCLGALHGAGVETPLQVDPEVAQQAFHRHGVPDWNDLTSPLVRHSAGPLV